MVGVPQFITGAGVKFTDLGPRGAHADGYDGSDGFEGYFAGSLENLGA